MRCACVGPLGGVLFVLALSVAGCTSSGTTDSPTSASGSSTSSVATTTSFGVPTTTLAGLSTNELLAGDDFFPERWSEGEFAGLRLHVCGNIEMLDREPLSELDDSIAIRLGGPSSDVHEIVFADSEEVIRAAYDEIVSNLVGCIDNPDRWLEGVVDDADPGADATSHVEQRLELIDLPSNHVGDRFAFAFTLYDNGDEFCHHHVAIIRNGSRLAILDAAEMWGDRELSYSEVAHIVEHAAERLSS